MVRAVLEWIRGGNDARVLADAAARTYPLRTILIAAGLPVAILLLGVLVRIGMHPARDIDEREFMNVGRHILETGLPLQTTFKPAHLFFDHTPLYPYFVALIEALPGPATLMIRAASLGFGVLTVLLVFLIGLRVRGLGAALVGSALVAANPFWITYSWYVRMEVPLSFFLVLATWLVIRERYLLAGLAIMVAVMLKEIALGFWILAVGYVLVRRSWRKAALIALPSPIAIAAWFAYAYSLDANELMSSLERWGRSSVGDEADNRRFEVPPLVWLNRLLAQVIGTLLTFAAGAAAVLAGLRRDAAHSIVLVTGAYCLLAVGTSFLISLKEVRFLIAVVPMLSLTVALLVDWDAVWAQLRGAWRRPAVISQGSGEPGRT
ncbi:MAG TPA: glycosyltransferase family 39 protein [Candidatus Limnocylindrales bacterium]|nr:glycosyltransferase family 39 protein [Candidatus Limnocylindrales bacterium]